MKASRILGLSLLTTALSIGGWIGCGGDDEVKNNPGGADAAANPPKPSDAAADTGATTDEDGGETDGGETDAGETDGGESDGGQTDGGDGGTTPPVDGSTPADAGDAG